jgi:hypothetical protein
MIDTSDILSDLRNASPVLLAVVGAALLGVFAWTGSVFASRGTRRARRSKRSSQAKSKRRRPVAPGLAPGDLGRLVEALRPGDRHALGQDLERLIQKHRNKRFLAFVVVRRDAVSPLSFTFLYQALRARDRRTAEVDEFQITVRDANELLRACTEPSHRT